MVQDQTRSSLELLLSVSRELAGSLDLQTVLARVLSLSTSNVGAERGSLIVISPTGQPVEAAINVNHKTLHPTLSEMQTILAHGLAGWVANTREPALVPDTSLDDRWAHRPDDDNRHTGSKSAICMPLLAHNDLIGVLTLVHAQTGFFTPDHLQLLQGIADLAAIAVRNANLYSNVQEAQRRYHELFEDSIDPILITDWQGTILEGNRQAVRVSGYSAGELAGYTVLDLHKPQDETLGVDFANLRDGQTISYESELLHKDGSTTPVEVYARKVFFGDTETLQWILRDISERKKLDSLRDDLSAMIYHDLRSPLANLISALDILNSLLPEEAAANLTPVFQIATRATDRLQRLISSLLDINRLEAGQAITNKQLVELSELIADAVDAVQPLVESKRQTLTSELAESLPKIFVDPDMIRRVLINLLENAIKFSPLGGAIRISAALNEGTALRVAVNDSGPGISEEAREVIFEKFMRLQSERYPKGFGLGLSFCRLAVQAHGGKIWVESQPGQGSTFLFELPAA